jgi:Family of unknown function (DUF5657)
MDLEQFITLLGNHDFLFKIILIVTSILYGLFALILSVQIKNLNKIINQIDFSSFFNLVTLIHFLGAIAIIFLSVVFL